MTDAEFMAQLSVEEQRDEWRSRCEFNRSQLGRANASHMALYRAVTKMLDPPLAAQVVAGAQAALDANVSALGVIRVVPYGPTGWWAVVGYCHCGCGRVARAVSGATVENVLWQWRMARRIGDLVINGPTCRANEGSGDPGERPVARGRRATKAGTT